MFKVVELTTGNEWEFHYFGELVFSVLDYYDGIDNDLLCEILVNLAKIGKGEISNFTIKSDDNLCIHRMCEVED